MQTVTAAGTGHKPTLEGSVGPLYLSTIQRTVERPGLNFINHQTVQWSQGKSEFTDDKEAKMAFPNCGLSSQLVHIKKQKQTIRIILSFCSTSAQKALEEHVNTHAHTLSAISDLSACSNVQNNSSAFCSPFQEHPVPLSDADGSRFYVRACVCTHVEIRGTHRQTSPRLTARQIFHSMRTDYRCLVSIFKMFKY